MTSIGRVLRNQVRGIAGALIVTGATILFTLEVWRLARTRPVSHLFTYAVVGLGIVLIITRSSGFRVQEEDDRPQYNPVRLAVNFSELVLQSVAAALFVLFVYGVVHLSTPGHVAARLALMQVVPLGFGAALANRLLHEMEENEDSAEEVTLLTNVAIFAAGGIFLALPLAVSIEVNLLAAAAGWPRLAAAVALSLVTAYLILYELEFRGQSRRTIDREWAALVHVGQTFIVYAVGVVVAALLLWGFDHLTFSLAVDVQKVVVVSFPTTVGGAAARVVL
jgi:putative integral membrane protein (TIGR02587 family)